MFQRCVCSLDIAFNGALYLIIGLKDPGRIIRCHYFRILLIADDVDGPACLTIATRTLLCGDAAYNAVKLLVNANAITTSTLISHA